MDIEIQWKFGRVTEFRPTFMTYGANQLIERDEVEYDNAFEYGLVYKRSFYKVDTGELVKVHEIQLISYEEMPAIDCVYKNGNPWLRVEKGVNQKGEEVLVFKEYESIKETMEQLESLFSDLNDE